jgi:hypothetical protein
LRHSEGKRGPYYHTSREEYEIEKEFNYGKKRMKEGRQERQQRQEK